MTIGSHMNNIHSKILDNKKTKDEFIGLDTGNIQDRSLVKNKDYSYFYSVQTEDSSTVLLDCYWQENKLRLINDGISPICIV